MKTHTIEEAVQAKTQIEQDILISLSKYEEEYGLEVSIVSLYHVPTMSGGKLYRVVIPVSIP